MTDGVMTPNRSTTLTLDTADYFLTEPGVSGYRKGAQIARDLTAVRSDRVDSTSTPTVDIRLKNVSYWPQGCWTLSSHQEDISNLNEYTIGVSLIIRKTSFVVAMFGVAGTIAVLNEFNLWRQNTDLPGLSYTTLITGTGDAFMRKQVPAGTSWQAQLSSGLANPFGGGTVDIPMDRVGESNITFPADQGFFLRWTMPATTQHYPGYIWSFYFGQYAVTIKGNGVCVLWETCHNGATPPVLVWRKRATFRYKTPPVGDDSQTLLIWPQRGPNGERQITFVGGQPDGAGYIGMTKADAGGTVAPNTYIYTVNEATRGGDVDESPGHVTKQGIIRFDIRRDIKLKFQISKLGWSTSGYLGDLPFDLSDFTTTQTVTLTGNTKTPAGTTLTVAMRDAESLADFTAGVTSGPIPSVAFTLPTATVRPAAVWNFSGNGSDTPVLYAYKYRREPVAQTGTATPFVVSLQEVSVEGFAGDASEQTGEMTYEGDTSGTNAKLSRRGLFSALLQTTYTPPGGTATVVPLMRGYVHRPVGKAGGKTGITFPNPNWYRYALPMVGMYFRLQKRLSTGLIKSFAVDELVPQDAGGGFTPYKATTAIQQLLLEAGFPISQINIGPGTPFDIDIRLWYGTTNFPDDLALSPMGNYAEMILRIARDYLFASLYWDDQNNYWSLIFSPQKDVNGNYTPLFTFQRATDRQIAGQRDYAPITDPRGWGNFVSKAPILNEFTSRPIPPEWNSVTVHCPVQYGTTANETVRTPATLRNFKSYKVPGSSVNPDPNHPDYLGTEFHIDIIDTGCVGNPDASGNNIQTTFNNCAFKARVFFERVCHGQQLYPFLAPLVFILDADTHKYRPLRYYDPVNVPQDGTQTVGLVRSVSPQYAHDNNQLAVYEVLVPKTGC